MRKLLAFAGALALATVVAAEVADWPQWNGPGRDGKSADKGLLKSWPAEGPTLLWKKAGIGGGFSSAVVADGTIYITGDQEGQCVLTALDLKGVTKWTAKVGAAWTTNHPGARSSVTVDDGRLYVMTAGGDLLCLNAGKGEKVWDASMKTFAGTLPKWGYAESPLIHKNLVVVTPGGQTPIVALDKKTGVPVWKSSGFQATAHYSSCIAVTWQGVSMVVQGTGDGIFAVDAKDGKLLWQNDWCRANTANCPTPAFDNGRVFWANGYKKGGICLKLDVKDGKVTATQEWTTDKMVCHHGGYVIVDGCIYGNNEGGWACLDLATGQPKWTNPGVGKGSLCYADGMLYLFNEKDGSAAIAPADPNAFEIKGRVKVAGSGPSWAHPVVVGGRLYLRYADTLYCFDVKTPAEAKAK